MVPVEKINPLLQGRHGVICVCNLAQMPSSHGGFSANFAA